MFRLIAAAALSASTTAHAGERDVKNARVMWETFKCAAYASYLGGDASDMTRLTERGMETGRTFLEAVQSGSLTPEDATYLPWAVLDAMIGPSRDFILGRVYQSAKTEAEDRVIKLDAVGAPLPVAEWRTDPAQQRVIARLEFEAANCDLF